MTFLAPHNYRIAAAIAQPLWLNDSEVVNAWEAYPQYVDVPAAVTVWHPQRGATDLTVPSGTVGMVNAGFGKFSSMGIGTFDANAVATSFSGATTPFSVAMLFMAGTAQTLNRYALAIANTADVRQTALAMVFNGTAANFQFFRRNSANVQVNGGVFSCAINTWYVVEAYYDGANLTSYLDGAIVDNALPLNPGGTIGTNTFCWGAYNGSSGHVLASTARSQSLLCTGGSVLSANTQALVREQLLRLKPVVV